MKKEFTANFLKFNSKTKSELYIEPMAYFFIRMLKKYDMIASFQGAMMLSVQHCADQLKSCSDHLSSLPNSANLYEMSSYGAELCDKLASSKRLDDSYLLWQCGVVCRDCAEVFSKSDDPYCRSCIRECSNCEVFCMDLGVEMIFNGSMYNFSYLN
jgi:hypothetical protein